MKKSVKFFQFSKLLFNVFVFLSCTSLKAQWTTKSAIPNVVQYQAAATDPATGKIYLFAGVPPGGSIPSNVTAELKIYNPATDTWTTGANCPASSFGSMACTGTDGNLYYGLGSGGNIGVGAFYRYTPSTDTWTTMASNSVRSWAGAMVSVNGKIYVIGGENSSGGTNRLSIYDIASNTWTTGANVPSIIFMHQAVAAPNGNIYVFGGQSAYGTFVNSTYKYNPTSNTWTTLSAAPPFTNSIFFGASLGIDGKIYMAGGKGSFSFNAGPFKNTLCAFDPTTETWTDLTNTYPLPTALGQNTFVASGANLYSMGGTNGSSVNYNYAFSLASATSNSPICIGSTINFTGLGGTSYSWTGPNGFTSSSATPSISNASGVHAGTYTCVITKADNSTITQTLTVVVDELPTVANAGADQSLAVTSTSATMAANTPSVGTGTWTKVSGPGTPVITTPSSPTTTISNLSPGTHVFRWTIANGACNVSTDEVTIDINNNPYFTSVPVLTATVGSVYTYAISAVSPTNNPTTLSANNTLPSWLSLQASSSSNGQQIGTSLPFSPGGAASDSNGNFYVVSNNTNQIYKITPDGTTAAWAVKPAGASTNTYGGCLVVGNYLYISTYGCSVGEIYRYDITAANPNASVTTIFNGTGIMNLAYRNGFLYGASYCGSKIIKIDLSNNNATDYLTGLPSSGPFGVGFTPNGDMLIPTWSNGTLLKYNGSTVSTVLSGLSNVSDVKVDADGNVYISFYGSPIRKYNSSLTSYVNVSGSVTQVWGMTLSASGVLAYPDASGRAVYRLQTGATLNGTPAISDIGTHAISLKVTDNTTSAEATQNYTLTVYGPSTFTVSDLSKSSNQAPFTLVDPSSNSAGAFTYSSSNTGVATVNGNTVTLTGAPGTTTITATQAASGLFLQTSKTFILTVTNPPSISSISPNLVNAGNILTISGTNFTGATSVTIGGVSVPFTVVNATTITLTAPQGLLGGIVTVTTPSGTATNAIEVGSNTNANCTTGWSNAWQTITTNGSGVLGSVTLKLDNTDANNDYGLYLELHSTDADPSSANPYNKFNSLLETSNTITINRNTGATEFTFSFPGTTSLTANTAYYVVLKEANGNPAGTGNQRIYFDCQNNTTDGGAGNNFGTLYYKFAMVTAVEVGSNTNANCTTGWSNAWQTITTNGSGVLGSVTLKLDNTDANNDYGLYLELHRTDADPSSANPYNKFNSLLETSNTITINRNTGATEFTFSFPGTTALTANTAYYVVLKGASGNPAGTGNQRIYFDCQNNTTDGGAGNNFGTLYYKFSMLSNLQVINPPSFSTSGTLSAFGSCVGDVSGEQSFTISGTFLTADIIVTAPSGFEISNTSGSGFANSITLAHNNGNINATVYVRMAADASGTPQGNITLTSAGASTQNVAVSGTVTSNGIRGDIALNFGGSGNYVSFANSTPFNFGPSSNYTLEAWVKVPANANSINTIVGKKTPGLSTNGYAFYVNTWGTNDRKLVLETYGTAAISTNSIPADTWTHVAVTVNAGNTTFYINGVVAGSGTVNTQTGGPDMNLGIFGGNTSYFPFTGSMDEVRIWNVVRTATELQNNRGTVSANTAGLIAYYKFNENAGTTLTDHSSTGANGSLNNFVLSGATSNWISPSFVDGPSITGSLEVCEGATTQLTHPIAGGTWMVSNANATVDTNGLVTGVSAGMVDIAYTYTINTCYFTDIHTITINAKPVISYANSPYSFIRGNAIVPVSVNSTGADVDHYTISPALPTGLNIDYNNGTITGTPTVLSAASSNTITATTTSGCTAETIISVEVRNDIPPANLSYNPNSQTVRLGTAITNMVPSNSGGTVISYTVSPNLPAGLIINGNTGVISGTLTSPQTGTQTFTVTATNSGGSTTATITLIFNTAPTNITLSPRYIYEKSAAGTTVGSLSTTDADAGDTHTYTLVSGDLAAFTLIGNQLKAVAPFNYSTKNSYNVRVRTTDAGGLSFEKTLIIDVLQAPQITGTGNQTGSQQPTAASATPSISKGYSSQLNVTGSGIVSYSWSPATGLSATNIANPVATPSQTTTYTVTVTHSSGAVYTQTITVVVNEDYNVIPHNILTPNGDGQNDVWVIENLSSYPDNKVSIFDQAGRMIFTKSSYTNDWNGSNLTEGTYYYIIDFGPNVAPKKGFITIIR